MNCRRVEALLETFADGELDPSQTLDVEAHVEQCESCTEQLLLLDSIKASTERAVRGDVQVSDVFMARVQAAMLAEEQRQKEQTPRSRFGAFRHVLPALGMAAGVALWLGMQQRGADAPDAAPDGPATLSANMGIEGALDRLIDYHSSPPAPQVTEPNQLPTFEANVGVRIRAPQLDAYGAEWEGANLVPVVNQQAASLRYKMPGHRVTVYVFDSRKVPIHRRLEKRLVAGSPVYVGQWRGYSVAARDSRGVGYAMTTDLDDAKITQLISSIH
jgi:anti-sigma factor RsiW